MGLQALTYLYVQHISRGIKVRHAQRNKLATSQVIGHENTVFAIFVDVSAEARLGEGFTQWAGLVLKIQQRYELKNVHLQLITLRNFQLSAVTWSNYILKISFRVMHL